MNKLAAVYAKAQRQMQQFLDGVCTVYALQAPETDGIYYGGFADFAGWEPLADWSDVACHLSFLQEGPSADTAADGSQVQARGRLFLAVSEANEANEARADLSALPAGSRLRVEQAGQVYWLACSGLPVRYPTHWEIEVRLWPERA